MSVQFGVNPADANNRVAHALASGVCLVAVGDASARNLTRDVNTPYGPFGHTVFNWACDPLSVLPPPAQ